MLSQTQQAHNDAVSWRDEGETVEQIMHKLECEYGDNFSQVRRGNVTQILWVYEDSRPSVVILELAQ